MPEPTTLPAGKPADGLRNRHIAMIALGGTIGLVCLLAVALPLQQRGLRFCWRFCW